jgi:hypothetical protein
LVAELLAVTHKAGTLHTYIKVTQHQDQAAQELTSTDIEVQMGDLD